MLAEKHLGSPDAAWRIAEFNDLNAPVAGQPLLIPRIPFGPGGLDPDGYQTVPLLTYERFSRIRKEKATVTQAMFEKQITSLINDGFHFITPDMLAAFMRFEARLPAKSVMIAICGGWRSTYDIAFPILKKHKVPACLFLKQRLAESDEGLSWKQLAEMAEAGIDIQCYATLSGIRPQNSSESFHAYVQRLSARLNKMRRKIETRLKKACRHIAYPAHPDSALLIALFDGAGFEAGYLIAPGGNPFFQDPFQIGLTPVNGSDTLTSFKQKLAVFQPMELR